MKNNIGWDYDDFIFHEGIVIILYEGQNMRIRG
jgi:hypothetical protein